MNPRNFTDADLINLASQLRDMKSHDLAVLFAMLADVWLRPVAAESIINDALMLLPANMAIAIGSIFDPKFARYTHQCPNCGNTVNVDAKAYDVNGGYVPVVNINGSPTLDWSASDVDLDFSYVCSACGYQLSETISGLESKSNCTPTISRGEVTVSEDLGILGK